MCLQPSIQGTFRQAAQTKSSSSLNGGFLWEVEEYQTRSERTSQPEHKELHITPKTETSLSKSTEVSTVSLTAFQPAAVSRDTGCFQACQPLQFQADLVRLICSVYCHPPGWEITNPSPPVTLWFVTVGVVGVIGQHGERDW